MFRFQGLEDLKNTLENYIVVFIDGDPGKSINHSLDQHKSDIKKETLTIRKQLEGIINELKKEHKQYYIIKNNYDFNFFEQIDALSLHIKLKNTRITD